MQCLLIADPSITESALSHLRNIQAAQVDVYSGGTLQRRRYELVIVASHVTSRGVLLGGDNYLSPLAIGSLAETAKAAAVFVASCDTAAAALDIAGQAKSAAVVYYPAMLDGATSFRMAAAFAERYDGEGLEASVDVATAAGYQVLNPILVSMAPDGFGSNSELTRLLLDMQRQQADTAADVRYLRQDVAALKDEVRRIEVGAGGNRGTIPMSQSSVIWIFILIVVLVLAVALSLSRLAGI